MQWPARWPVAANITAVPGIERARECDFLAVNYLRPERGTSAPRGCAGALASGSDF